MNSKVYNALCAAFALAYLLAPALIFIPVMLWEASPLPSAFCMAKPARRRRPSMAGVGATPFVDARLDGENQVEAHKNVMPQTFLGILSNWLGSLWSAGSRTTGEPSGSLLSERHGGIPGHMSVDDSSSEAEDVVSVGKSSVFVGAGLREYVPHLLPLHKLGCGIATMVSPVNDVAGTCGETHADLDEGVSSELVDVCDEAEISVRLRFICDRFFSEGFAHPRLSARFLDALLEEELNDSENKAHRDSLTEVAEPECGLVPESAEETLVLEQESVQTPSGLDNAGLKDPKPKSGTVEGLNEAFALSSWQSVNGFFGECLSTGLPTPMEIDDDLAWSEVVEVENSMEIDDDVVEVAVPDAVCGEKLVAHTCNPMDEDLQYVSQSVKKDCDTNKIPACVPQQVVDDKVEHDVMRLDAPIAVTALKPQSRGTKKSGEQKKGGESLPASVSGLLADGAKKVGECTPAVLGPKDHSKTAKPVSQSGKKAKEPKVAAKTELASGSREQQPEETKAAPKVSMPGILRALASRAAKEQAKDSKGKAKESKVATKTELTSGSREKQPDNSKAETKAPMAVTLKALASGAYMEQPKDPKVESSTSVGRPKRSLVKGKKSAKSFDAPTNNGLSAAEFQAKVARRESLIVLSFWVPSVDFGPNCERMLVKKQKFALAWFLKPGAASSSKKVVETRIWLPGNPQTDNSRMTMAVVTPFDSLHIKMQFVRFTKRTSCRSVGPGAKPMRSEPKVDPEASDSKDWIIVSLWDRHHAPPVSLVLSLGLA
ncbi:hypothetical protein J3Q64DRAFT_1853026 [Phycomyces blakesleeanus]|uniref:Uncharacterized protein n=1 Tax=Phycomyces blakesleeanus TaxID=4837 RepID=A0ABR3AK43_PHYBL